MLRNVKQLEGRALQARDGVIGEVKDVYFDDSHWHVRYFVVETGAWLQRRRVLVAPEALGPLDWNQRSFPANLTMEEVRHSPAADTAQPISRQYEESLRQHHGWPAYWDYTFGPGGLASPILAPTPAANTAEPGFTDGNVPLARRSDPHLRSANDTMGYHIDAIDGPIGHVRDFLVDEHGWQIRYVIVDTRNWWPGKKVLVAPDWIKAVRWAEKRVTVDLTRDAIQGSPPYDPATPWDPAYAAELHDYYDRPRYADREKDVGSGATKREREQ